MSTLGQTFVLRVTGLQAHLLACDHMTFPSAGFVQVNAALLRDWMDHLDLVNVVSSQLGSFCCTLKAKVNNPLFDSMLVVSLHLYSACVSVQGLRHNQQTATQISRPETD